MDATFIACTAKALPSEKNIESAATAIRINPANRPSVALAFTGMILPPEHLALLTDKYWGNGGVKLTVGFLEQTPDDLAARLIAHMNAWGEFCNVKFARSNTDPQVRITRTADGYWSYLGTDILHIPAGQPTMCLQGFTMNTPESEFHRVVRHETGHTLGFPHEHMRREIVQAIDVAKAIAYFRQTQGWNATVVQQQVLTPLDEASIMGTPHADRTSIMCYSLPGSIMKDGQPIPGGTDIEDQDKAFAAKYYPLAITPPAPPPPPGPTPPAVGGVSMVLDLAKKSIIVSAPSGWTLGHKTSDTGETVMSPNTDMQAWADELELALPAAGPDLEAAKVGSLGGIITSVLKLITDLRAQDWTAAIKDVIDILTQLTSAPPTGGNGGVITFAQHAVTQAKALKIDWGKLIGVLLGKILPVILGA